jgi:hypothetical protein
MTYMHPLAKEGWSQWKCREIKSLWPYTLALAIWEVSKFKTKRAEFLVNDQNGERHCVEV